MTTIIAYFGGEVQANVPLPFESDLESFVKEG